MNVLLYRVRPIFPLIIEQIDAIIPTLARRRNNLRAVDRLLITGNEIIAIGLRCVGRIGRRALG